MFAPHPTISSYFPLLQSHTFYPLFLSFLSTPPHLDSTRNNCFCLRAVHKRGREALTGSYPAHKGGHVRDNWSLFTFSFTLHPHLDVRNVSCRIDVFLGTLFQTVPILMVSFHSFIRNCFDMRFSWLGSSQELTAKSNQIIHFLYILEWLNRKGRTKMQPTYQTQTPHS